MTTQYSECEVAKTLYHYIDMTDFPEHAKIKTTIPKSKADTNFSNVVHI